MLVGIDDRSGADAPLQGIERDVVGQRASAGNVEEEAAGIIVGRHNAYLIVAYALLGSDPVMPGFAGLVHMPLERCPFEGFAKVDLIHLHAHTGPHLECRRLLYSASRVLKRFEETLKSHHSYLIGEKG